MSNTFLRIFFLWWGAHFCICHCFQAFQDAFANACQYNGNSAILIPKGTFLVKSAVFRGPCKGPIEFSLLGIMKAPAGPVGGDHWVVFMNIDRLAITGSGTFDGQGETAWRHNDCTKNPNCRRLPIVSKSDKERLFAPPTKCQISKRMNELRNKIWEFYS